MGVARAADADVDADELEEVEDVREWVAALKMLGLWVGAAPAKGSMKAEGGGRYCRVGAAAAGGAVGEVWAGLFDDGAPASGA